MRQVEVNSTAPALFEVRLSLLCVGELQFVGGGFEINGEQSSQLYMNGLTVATSDRRDRDSNG